MVVFLSHRCSSVAIDPVYDLLLHACEQHGGLAGGNISSWPGEVPMIDNLPADLWAGAWICEKGCRHLLPLIRHSISQSQCLLSGIIKTQVNG